MFYYTINSKTTYFYFNLLIFDLKFRACCNLQKDTNYKSFWMIFQTIFLSAVGSCFD